LTTIEEENKSPDVWLWKVARVFPQEGQYIQIIHTHPIFICPERMRHPFNPQRYLQLSPNHQSQPSLILPQIPQETSRLRTPDRQCPKTSVQFCKGKTNLPTPQNIYSVRFSVCRTYVSYCTI